MLRTLSCRNTRALLLLALWAVRCPTATGLAAPCIAAGLSQTYLADKLNPRTSGDLTVLLNMPHNRVYCSALAAKFLILGVWAERHHLELNQPQPFNGSAHPDAASRPSWRVVDVTEVSRIAEFDFLMDESHGLIKDTEYFVALSGCSSTQCRTAGFAKFNTWQQGGSPQNLAAIIAGSCAAVVAVCVIAIGVTLGVRIRNKDQTTLRAIVCCCTKADYKETAEAQPADWPTYLVCDRQTAQLGTDSSASAAAEIPSSDGLGYTTYAEILSDVGRHDNDQSGAGRSVAASSGSEDRRSSGVENRALDRSMDLHREMLCSKNDIEMRDSGASQRSSDLEVISNHEMHTGFGKLDLPAGKF